MRAALVQLIMAGLLLLGVIGAYSLWYGMVSAKSAAAAALENQINANTEAAARVNAAKAALADIASDEVVVRSYFVTEAAVVPFIDDLEARGRALKTVVAVTSVAAQPVAGRPALSLVLTIDGTFDAVMRTVGAIEYAPYDIAVSSLSLSLTPGSVWRADLGLVVGSASSTPGAVAPAVPVVTNVPVIATSTATSSSVTQPPTNKKSVTPTLH